MRVERKVSCLHEHLTSTATTRKLVFECSVGGGNLPSKPKKPCAYPGCPALVTGRYCEEHAAKRNSEYEKYGRDKNTKRRYGRAWKQSDCTL